MTLSAIARLRRSIFVSFPSEMCRDGWADKGYYLTETATFGRRRWTVMVMITVKRSAPEFIEMTIRLPLSPAQ